MIKAVIFLPLSDQRYHNDRFLAAMTDWPHAGHSADPGPGMSEAIYHTAFRNCFVTDAA
jgi:hypothetical protein